MIYLKFRIFFIQTHLNHSINPPPMTSSSQYRTADCPGAGALCFWLNSMMIWSSVNSRIRQNARAALYLILHLRTSFENTSGNILLFEL